MWRRTFLSVVAAVLVIGLCGCSKCFQKESRKKEAPAQVVTLANVPAPAKAAIEKLTAGGQIRKIEKAEEAGKTVYDVEATVQGKDVEYDVAADGTVLSSEQSVPYASLPAPVQAAAQKYFGSAEGLKASQEVENGKTFYEVEGTKSGAAVVLKLSDTGQILEEEKE